MPSTYHVYRYAMKDGKTVRDTLYTFAADNEETALACLNVFNRTNPYRDVSFLCVETATSLVQIA